MSDSQLQTHGLAAMSGTEALQKLRLFRLSLIGLPRAPAAELDSIIGSDSPDCLVALGCSNYRDCYELSSILGAAHSLRSRAPQSPGVIVIGDCRLDCVCSSRADPIAKGEMCLRHSMSQHFKGISSPASTNVEHLILGPSPAVAQAAGGSGAAPDLHNPGPAYGQDLRGWRQLLKQLLETVKPSVRPQLIVLNNIFPAMLLEVLQVIQSVWRGMPNRPACKILVTSMFKDPSVGELDPAIFAAVIRPSPCVNWTCETEFVENAIEFFRLGEFQLCKDLLLSQTKDSQRSCLPLAFVRRMLCWEFDGFGFDSDFDNSFVDLFSHRVLKPEDFVVDAGPRAFFVFNSRHILPTSMKFELGRIETLLGENPESRESPSLRNNRFLRYLYCYSFNNFAPQQYKALLDSLSLEKSRGTLFHVLRYSVAFIIKTGNPAPAIWALNPRQDIGTGQYNEFIEWLRSNGEQVSELLPERIFGNITVKSGQTAFHDLALNWYREGLSEGCHQCAYGHCYMETSGFHTFSAMGNGISAEVAENVLRFGFTAFQHFCSIY
jgi:hypothetical protein